MALNHDFRMAKQKPLDSTQKKDGSGFEPKVLVADDDLPSRLLLCTALKQWGYEVVEAANGEEAWALLQQPNPPRLLIVDWIMPKMDGIKLCLKIRQELEDHNRFYIILLSQISGTSNIRTAIDGGANEFVSKPFDYQELRSRVLSASRLMSFNAQLLDEIEQLKKELADKKSQSK